jgi:hypothetical protein
MPVEPISNADIGIAYSTLTGVLAGFAFAGLVLIITQRLNTRADGEPDSKSRPASDVALLLLFAAFLGLVLSSLSYAVVGGESKANSRAGLEHVIVGAGFGIAGLVLFLAILELMADIDFSMHTRLRFWTTRIGPLVVLGYVWSGAHDVSRIKDADWLDYLGLICMSLLLVCLIIVPWKWNPMPVNKAAVYFAGLGMLIPFASAVSVALIVNLVSDADVPAMPAAISLVVTLLGAGSFVFASGPTTSEDS